MHAFYDGCCTAHSQEGGGHVVYRHCVSGSLCISSAVVLYGFVCFWTSSSNSMRLFLRQRLMKHVYLASESGCRQREYNACNVQDMSFQFSVSFLCKLDSGWSAGGWAVDCGLDAGLGVSGLVEAVKRAFHSWKSVRRSELGAFGYVSSDRGSSTPQPPPLQMVQSAEGGKGKDKRERIIVVVRSPCQDNYPADAHTSAHKSVLESANPAWIRSVHLDAPGQRHGQQPVSATADPRVVKQDKSSRGSIDTTKTRSHPQRVGMYNGERPIGAAEGKQTNTMASCPPPPPKVPPTLYPSSP